MMPMSIHGFTLSHPPTALTSLAMDG
jgi:hypothetical protein